LPKDDNVDTTTTFGDDNTATNSTVVGANDERNLKEALFYLDLESLKKAQQKVSTLSCLRVRDETSSLKGQVDSISRWFTHSKQGTPQADNLMEKMDA
jgi:hypothetical protein